MATAVIHQSAKSFREFRYIVEGGSVTVQYRDVSTDVAKTVGYADYATAKTACDAAVAPGVEPTVERDGIFYTLSIETYTYGDWTTV